MLGEEEASFAVFFLAAGFFFAAGFFAPVSFLAKGFFSAGFALSPDWPARLEDFALRPPTPRLSASIRSMTSPYLSPGFTSSESGFGIQILALLDLRLDQGLHSGTW